MESPEYPELYLESDSCAIESQKKYFWTYKAKIGLPIAVAVLAALSSSNIQGFGVIAMGIAAILLASLILTMVIDLRRVDRIWFSSRAIAETVKKESWLFMMQAKPYDPSQTESNSVKIFLENLRKILSYQSHVSPELTKYFRNSPQITEKMRGIRKKTIAERLNYYRKNRIHDERLWYTKKADFNRKQESRLFIVSWVLQFLAIFLAFTIIYYSKSVVNPVGSLTTAAAAIISWMSARSYRELSQSYGLIAQELSFFEEQTNQVSNQDELDELIQDVERTISREHTIWLARRTATP